MSRFQIHVTLCNNSLSHMVIIVLKFEKLSLFVTFCDKFFQKDPKRVTKVILWYFVITVITKDLEIIKKVPRNYYIHIYHLLFPTLSGEEGAIANANVTDKWLAILENLTWKFFLNSLNLPNFYFNKKILIMHGEWKTPMFCASIITGSHILAFLPPLSNLVQKSKLSF